jgi:hypothetical protein
MSAMRHSFSPFHVLRFNYIPHFPSFGNMEILFLGGKPMSFHIKVRDANKAFAHAGHAIVRNGGTLAGSAAVGEFEGSGVRGNYRLTGDSVFVITITKKPFICPESMVEGKIRTFFTGGGF